MNRRNGTGPRIAIKGNALVRVLLPHLTEGEDRNNPALLYLTHANFDVDGWQDGDQLQWEVKYTEDGNAEVTPWLYREV